MTSTTTITPMYRIDERTVAAATKADIAKPLNFTFYFRYRITLNGRSGNRQWKNLQAHLAAKKVKIVLSIVPTKKAKDRGVKAVVEERVFELGGGSSGGGPLGTYVTVSDIVFTLVKCRHGEKLKDLVSVTGKVINSVNGEGKKIWESPLNDFFLMSSKGNDYIRLSRKNFAEVPIKLSTKATLPVKGSASNQIVVPISQGVGWYVVKKAEKFDRIVKRIFGQISDSEMNLMQEINAHLGMKLPVLPIIHPGQIILVALEQNNKKLASMKKDAIKAQKEWKSHSKNLSATQQTALAHLTDVTTDLLHSGAIITPYKLPPKYDPEVYLRDELKDWKGHTDSMFAFASEVGNETVRNYNNLAKDWIEFKNKYHYRGNKGNKSVKAGWKRFKQLHAQDLSKIRSSIGKSVLDVDYGIRAEHGAKLRQSFKKSTINRNPSILKSTSIKQYTEGLKSAGKLANGLRVAGAVGIGVTLYDAGDVINDSRAHGKDHFGKVATIEGFKTAFDIGGGIAGGYAGVAGGILLVAAVGATGGLALVIVGVAGVGVGFGGSYGGKILGLTLGKGIDEHVDTGFTDIIFEYLEK